MLLLTWSNETYDFSRLMGCTSIMALDELYFRETPDAKFEFRWTPQSQVYLRCLKSFCEGIHWEAFFSNLVNYAI